jgi:hypothetical protein
MGCEIGCAEIQTEEPKVHMQFANQLSYSASLFLFSVFKSFIQNKKKFRS